MSSRAIRPWRKSFKTTFCNCQPTKSLLLLKTEETQSLLSKRKKLWVRETIQEIWLKSWVPIRDLGSVLIFEIKWLSLISRVRVELILYFFNLLEKLIHLFFPHWDCCFCLAEAVVALHGEFKVEVPGVVIIDAFLGHVKGGFFDFWMVEFVLWTGRKDSWTGMVMLMLLWVTKRPVPTSYLLVICYYNMIDGNIIVEDKPEWINQALRRTSATLAESLARKAAKTADATLLASRHSALYIYFLLSANPMALCSSLPLLRLIHHLWPQMILYIRINKIKNHQCCFSIFSIVL